MATDEEVRLAAASIWDSLRGREWDNSPSTLAAKAALGCTYLRSEEEFECAVYVVADAAGSLKKNESREYAKQCHLFRDVFGNPFRPVAIDTDWLSPRVVLLAQAIYEDRAYDRISKLGEAIKERGCDDREILNHCRSQTEHTRGCWVVDAILGRS
jgi:hypothetical protein